MDDKQKERAFEKLIQRAARLLGTSADRSAIEEALVLCGMSAWISLGHTKEGRASVQRLAAALTRVAAVLNSNDLPPIGDGSLPAYSQVKDWIAACNRIAGRSRKLSSHWLGFSSGVGYFEKYCAVQAYSLMLSHGKPIKTTKGSEFEKLTACLASMKVSRRPTTQFHHYCREVVNRISEARKTVLDFTNSASHTGIDD